jgi:ATP-binding cassette subfamily B protein
VAVVQLFGDEARSEGRFAERNQRLLDATRLSNIYDAGMYSLVDGMGSVFVALILWYGSGAVAPHLAALGVEVEPVSVGLLVAFMDYVERLFRPLRELSGKITILQRAAASLSKIQWLLEQPGAQDGSAELPQFRGALSMRGVSFRYRPDSEPILREVDLDVSPGEVVAIVGATGSGKTTLTRLLDRSYEGYEGSIRLDGVELRDIARDPLRRHVIAMRQDVQVFSESLRFNVDLGKSEISEAAREQAVDSAQARPMVERLGWEHPLKDRGADLSVGEGQLLSFARTCAHNPGLLILDEATASVDSLTEARIQAAIAGMLKGRTVMVIAHRLSTIQRADRICVMEAGRIVEQGSHAELMSLGGRYASLVEAGRAALSSPQMEAP